MVWGHENPVFESREPGCAGNQWWKQVDPGSGDTECHLVWLGGLKLKGHLRAIPTESLVSSGQGLLLNLGKLLRSDSTGGNCRGSIEGDAID